jgi:signal transduction histidine kinase
MLLDAETAERGYLVSGDSSYLQPYNTALPQIDTSLRTLRVYMKEDRSQLLKLDSLEEFVRQKLAYILNLNNLKRQKDEPAIAAIMATHKGKFWMDKIRHVSEAMQLAEETLFNERRVATEKSIARSKTVFQTEGIFALLVTMFLGYLILTELKRRTRAEKNMLAANQELHMKNKEVEQFAYIASHDLQEPLRTVANFSMLLNKKLEGNPDPAVASYLGYVTSGTTRMSKLISDLLEYSRFGKDAHMVVIDCKQLVEEVISDMHELISETKTRIQLGYLPVLTGYPFLKSLFQNLISNAIKFSGKNQHPVISISSIERKTDFLFSVKDNGIGIEKEYFDRIFIIFQRLHNRSEYPGTGIGLAQCRKIAELHKGAIWVDSEQGKGTTFHFTIAKKQESL